MQAMDAESVAGAYDRGTVVRVVWRIHDDCHRVESRAQDAAKPVRAFGADELFENPRDRPNVGAA
jgi:hypothetical protein